MPDGSPKKTSRIQTRNRGVILDAALEVFSRHGYRGATLDQIASDAGLSKPNILYYFEGKEDIHLTLLNKLMQVWLDPLKAIDPEGDPAAEILAYVQRKLDMARDLPRESRLFAGEVLQGAPRFGAFVAGPLKTLVDEKAALIRGWVEAGRIAPVDPYHLIFSIWAATQHYADFDTQVRAILQPVDNGHFDEARAFLRGMYAGLLRPGRDH